ncbi:MAG: hypothetical protein RL722_1705, partial [Pseudomonadota bacterium]
MPPGGPGGPDGAGGTTTVALRPLPAQPATTTTAAAPAPCSRASEALARWTAGQPTSADAPPAWIAGQPATLDAGLARAAELLASARQPLIGGLATDVQGTRALMRLAGRIGAISDHLNGEAQALATRLLHDQGAWQVTLGEVVDRAEVMVCIGSDPAARHPRFWQRLRADRDDSPLKQIVMLGLGRATRATALETARLATAGRAEPPQIEALDLDAGDLFDQLQALALAFRRRPPAGLPAAWTELAAVLKGSTYTGFIWEPGVWPRHGELVAQALQGVIATLNHSATRAGSFMLGGGEGGATALQVHTWLTGLPLRTRLDRRPGGAIDHDP